MRNNHTVRIGIAVAAGALAAGCGASTAPGASASNSALPSASASTGSAAPLPTVTKTEKPPREPTDNIPETGWVVGMVTRGGTGPCYGLIADDGTRYALYNADGINLAQGDRVKVQLETTLLKIYCGPGQLMAMTASQPIK